MLGEILGYLIVAALLVGAYFAIKHLSKAKPGAEPALSAKAAKWLTYALYAVALLVILSALGVCPQVGERTGLDPLLNRTPR